MRKVVLYIAMSLDGFVADNDGGVDWLIGDGSNSSDAGSYPHFIETIDTVIMGYTTYNQIITELSSGAWPYKDKVTYVLTHKEIKSTKDIVFTGSSLSELISSIQQTEGKDIWICGGSSIVNQFIKQDLLDTFHITIIPTLLGSGIPLFSEKNYTKRLKLISHESHNGMVDIVYNIV